MKGERPAGITVTVILGLLSVILSILRGIALIFRVSLANLLGGSNTAATL